MPSPRKIDPPYTLQTLLTCPDCFKLMRITTIEADDGHDRIKFVCDDCGTEEILNAPTLCVPKT
jgi:hypothetical protein